MVRGLAETKGMGAAHLVGEPLDEAVLVEVGGHADESRKPGECVPGSAVGQAVLPCHLH